MRDRKLMVLTILISKPETVLKKVDAIEKKQDRGEKKLNDFDRNKKNQTIKGTRVTLGNS